MAITSPLWSFTMAIPSSSALNQPLTKPGPLALIGLIAITRMDHFGSAFALPDASLAVFFLAGLWFGGRGLFLSLLVLAGLIDYVAIARLDVSDFCISPAYVFLVSAYGLLWATGAHYREKDLTRLTDLAGLFGMMFLAVSLAFLLTNGSFYLLSDNVSNRSWDAFLGQFTRYYPHYLTGTMTYAAAIVLPVILFKGIMAHRWASKSL